MLKKRSLYFCSIKSPRYGAYATCEKTSSRQSVNQQNMIKINKLYPIANFCPCQVCQSTIQVRTHTLQKKRSPLPKLPTLLADSSHDPFPVDKKGLTFSAIIGRIQTQQDVPVGPRVGPRAFLRGMTSRRNNVTY